MDISVNDSTGTDNNPVLLCNSPLMHEGKTPGIYLYQAEGEEQLIALVIHNETTYETVQLTKAVQSELFDQLVWPTASDSPVTADLAVKLKSNIIPLCELSSLSDDDYTYDSEFDGASSSSEEEDDENKEGYSAFEHLAIGNSAFAEACQTDFRQDLYRLEQADPPLIVSNLDGSFDFLYYYDGKTLRLSPGEFVALAGDFYGTRTPICTGSTKKQRDKLFADAFKTLIPVNSEDKYNVLLKLKEAFGDEIEAAKAGVSDNMQPHDAALCHEEHNDPTILYGKITRYFPYIKTYMEFNSHYMVLLSRNYDHFGGDAELAFGAGYRVAVETAKQAYAKRETAEGTALLSLALTQILFACHYLTDLFAAGHIRTPRRRLIDDVYRRFTFAQSMLPFNSSITAGLITNAMHNEDGYKGLWVSNRTLPQRSRWRLKGDNCYFDPDARGNIYFATEIVSKVLKEIVNVSRLGETIDKREPGKSFYFYRRYIPRVLKNDNERQNIEPLLKPAEKGTHEFAVRKCKETGYDKGDTGYDDNWNPSSVYAALKKHHFLTPRPGEHIKFLSHSDKEFLETEFRRSFPVS